MRKKTFIATGIPTIFMIFSVLCLVILALTGWGTSMNDLAASRNALSQSEKYYEACSLGTDILQQLRQAAAGDPEPSGGTGSGPDVEAVLHRYMQSAESPRDYPFLQSFTLDGETGTIRIGFSRRLSLQIDFAPAAQEPYYTVLGWYTVSAGGWHPDQTQRLYIPGDLD